MEIPSFLFGLDPPVKTLPAKNKGDEKKKHAKKKTVDQLVYELQQQWMAHETEEADREDVRIKLVNITAIHFNDKWRKIITTINGFEYVYTSNALDQTDIEYRHVVCNRRIKKLLIVLNQWMEEGRYEFDVLVAESMDEPKIITGKIHKIPTFSPWFHKAISDISKECATVFRMTMDTTKFYSALHKLVKTYAPVCPFSHFSNTLANDDWRWKAPYPDEMSVLKQLATDHFTEKEILGLGLGLEL